MLTIHSNKSDPEAIAFCHRFLADNHPPRFVLGRNEYAVGIAETLDIDGFIDDFANDKTFMGKTIFKMTEVPMKSMVISAVIFVAPLTALRHLQRRGLVGIDYFRFQQYSGLPLKAVEYLSNAHNDIEENMEQYEWLYARMADQQSKNVLEALLNFRFSGDLSYMRDFGPAQDRQYFEDFLDLGAGEVFVDGGGFDGQTSLDFIRHCPDYRRVHLFEPDTDNLALARRNLAGCRDIIFHNSGLDECKKTIRFSARGDSASKVCELGSEVIPVDSLDHVVNETITFIKMDIEGTERVALTGASKHVLNDHPKLAICCYHKHDDLWKIPRQILTMREDYALHLRHYTDGLHETVVFCVPSKI